MILSHRGFWKTEIEKNSIEAFKRSFSKGFGTETDIRDYKGKLVISHDIPNNNPMTVEAFFELYKSYSGDLPLALNIKADGLQKDLLRLIDAFEIKNYFVFDMSIPDTIGYIKHQAKVFIRESEHEKDLPFYDKIKGVWLDEFQGNWISPETINTHLNNGKQVCIVSPELHKRNWSNEWNLYKENYNLTTNENLHICTDMPTIAKTFFNEQN